MKQQMRYLLALILLLKCSTALWADGQMTVTKQKKGVLTEEGTVTHSVSGETCTLTVISPTGYSISASDIKAIKVLDTGNMEAPLKRAISITEPLSVTGSGNSYTFAWPGSPYDVNITVEFQPNTDTDYTVEHYQQNVDGSYPATPTESEDKTGTTDEQTDAETKSYDGFTAGTVTQEQIAADGSTVIRIYYTRDSYSITFDSDGGSNVSTITDVHGATVDAPAEPTRDGYTFAGWYDGNSEYVFSTMPIGGQVLTAHWTANTYTDNDITAETNGDGTVIITELPQAAVGTDGGLTLPSAISGRNVTEITDDAFNGVDMTRVEYVDLSDTDITGLTVDRGNGLFGNLNENALVYLPAGNSSGENVVVDGLCSEYKIYDTDKKYKVKKAFTANKVSYSRIYNNQVMSTVYLPFPVPTASAGGTFYEFDGIDGTTVKTKAVLSAATEANTPYIFVPSSTGSISLNSAGGITVSTTVDQQVNAQLVGTYEPITWATDQANIYGFAAETKGEISEGMFVRVKAGASINPFRAYLEQTGGNLAPMLTVDLSGSTTGIENTWSAKENLRDGVWYTIDGRRLEGIPQSKGVYIHNGRKEVVK